MLRISAHPTKIKVAIGFILDWIEGDDSCYCAEFTGNCDILWQRNSPFYSEILNSRLAICESRFYSTIFAYRLTVQIELALTAIEKQR